MVNMDVSGTVHRILPQTGSVFSQQTRDIDDVLVQCWHIVCDDGPTLNQHMINAPCLLGEHSGAGWYSHKFRHTRLSHAALLVWDLIPKIGVHFQQSKRLWTNVGLMLVNRPRRWPNIGKTLDQRIVFSGNCCYEGCPFTRKYISLQCWGDVGPTRLTFGQHWPIIGRWLATMSHVRLTDTAVRPVYGETLPFSDDSTKQLITIDS